MTSIQDVADQINAKLDQIISNTAQSVTIGGQIRTELQTLDGHVTTLDAHLQAGFTAVEAGIANLADGLFAVWEVEKALLVESRHHSDQNDTMICLLRNSDELLCGITRKLTIEIDLTRTIAAAVGRLAGIAERVEPAAAADLDRLAALRAQIEECCPPVPPQPEPCPEECPTRPGETYQPRGQDWVPLHQRPPGTPG